MKIIPNIYGNELKIAKVQKDKYVFYDGNSICPGKMEGYILPPNIEDYSWYPNEIYWMCIDCTDFYTSEEITELWQEAIK